MKSTDEASTKTNFDKWKENLTVEDVAAISSTLCKYFMDSDSDCQDICPSYHFCKSASITGKAVDARELFSRYPDDDCSSVVLEWANSPAREETNDHT